MVAPDPPPFCKRLFRVHFQILSSTIFGLHATPPKTIRELPIVRRSFGQMVRIVDRSYDLPITKPHLLSLPL
jgi:hypothetical protein